MHNNTVVIIPCYNAVNSIVRTIRNVFAYLPQSKIIIVDDNSPDGTQSEVKKYFAEDKRLLLIVRKKKKGRGSAVIRGIREGLRDKKIEYFVEMDADLCHDPKYIQIMINNCKSYDAVIASKYLKESTIKGLNKNRIIFSKIVNYYLKLMLNIPITDYTNGFRCYKRKALEKIDLNSFHSNGFIVLSEIIHKIYQNKGLLREIPFNFVHKEINRSNFNFAEIKEAFLTILILKFNLNYFKLGQGKNKMSS